MKKYFKLFLILPLIVLLTGCSNKEQIELMSRAIMKYHVYGKYDIKGINRGNKKLLDEFIENQSTEDKEVNVSRRSETFAESTEDNKYIYKKDGEYYIKYIDLDFCHVDYNGKSYAVVDFDGTAASFYKDEIPILYEQTKDNSRYDYKFVGCATVEDNLKECYGKSRGDNSYLAIQYTYKGLNISNINMIYSDMIYYEIEKKETNKLVYYICILGVTILLGFGIYKVIKRIKRSHEF